MPTDQMDTTDLMVSEIMVRWPQTVGVFIEHGMLCVGCPIGPFHTIAEACDIYNLDITAFERDLAMSITAGEDCPP
ncbi:DUF1858 domain-containing protein [Sulfitobacter sp. SK011]|uniref:DUF1858 domain-containing protein n=1 Tax=Sulfitobacter sp. SK011 TaxID=1389004 RepID=UPI000E0A0F86|nr:DUF1858 domain-containing protein [Sulfitobacter sp. SK011]AXI44430.1 hypothetical protein C1J02_15765 [Sulfitobacter sp. SK011]